MSGAEFYIAVSNKGLWPKMILMPNEELGVLVYNHPSHGMGIGANIELWVSNDEGRNWQFRSTVSDHTGGDEKSNRMNLCAGMNTKGEIIALVKGYPYLQQRPGLPMQCCISSDNGKTWERYLTGLEGVSYGNIVALDDGTIITQNYKDCAEENADKRFFCSFLIESKDQGRSWQEKNLIAEGVSEVQLLNCGNGKILATGRTVCQDRMDTVLPHGSGEKLYVSEDNGATWSKGKPVSPQGQENASLLKLKDGRILYCFTSRIPGLFGVVFRVSEDGGETWSPHQPLITIPATDWLKTDAGYPSSVQLEDETIVTAYYFGPKKPEYAGETTPWHQSYHTGIARWRI